LNRIARIPESVDESKEIEARLPSHVVHRISVALDNFDFDAALRLLPENSTVHGLKPD